MIVSRFFPAAALLLAAAPMVADAAVTVERAVVPLTHEAVARAYNPGDYRFPVVGDPGAPDNDRWADLFFRYHFTVENRGPQAASVRVEAVKPVDMDVATEFRLEPEAVDVGPGQKRGVTLVVKVPGEVAAKLPQGYTREVAIRFRGAGVVGGDHTVVFWVPAVAKILAGSDGTGIPADVIPVGADYKEEFSGGWDGARFRPPFVRGTRTQIARIRELAKTGESDAHHIPSYVPRLIEQHMEKATVAGISDEPSFLTFHKPYAQAILDLASRWTETGDRAYADRARDLILAYVARAERLGGGSKGRVGKNGLEDGWFCDSVFKAIDTLVGTDVLSEADLAEIIPWMVRSEANIMQDQVFAYSNMQTEENYPIMVAGLYANDFKLLRFAYYPPYGMEGQLSGAFYADGFHREHQHGYHFRTINPIADQAEALLRLGFCGYDERIHRALMNQMRGTIAPGDDLGGQDLQAAELAWLRYRDPLAADWLRLHRGRSRLPLHAGGEKLPEGSDAYWKAGGTHLTGMGVTILRAPDARRGLAFAWGRPEKRQAQDYMDYRLFYADGRGRGGFGAGQFGNNETPAHNCIVANEHVNATPGVPVEMRLDGPFPYCVADNPGPKPITDTDLAQPWPYPWIWPNAGDRYQNYWPLGLPYPHAGQGKWWREWRPMEDVTRWSRTVALVEDGFLIADAVALDSPGRIDRPIHVGGSLVPEFAIEGTTLTLTPADEPLGTAEVYQSMLPPPPSAQPGSSPEAGFPRGQTADTWAFTGRMGGVGVTTTVLGEPGTDVIHVGRVAKAWGKAAPFMLVRREGVKFTRFVVFIEPYGAWEAKERTGTPRLKGMNRLPVTDAAGQPLADEQAAAVEMDFGDKRVVVLLNDSGAEIKAGGVSTTQRFTAALAK